MLVILFPGPAAAGADANSPPARRIAADVWHEVRRKVIEELAKRDVIEWSNQLAAQLDQAERRALFTALDVFIRAGHKHRVPDVVRRLCRLELPTSVHRYIAEDQLIKYQLWDSLRILLDACPKCCPTYFYKYRRHWWQNGDRAELEAWLKTRYQADWRSWHQDYFWVVFEQGKMPALVEELRAEIRRKPADGQLAFKYLAAVRVLAGGIRAPEDRPNVAWLGDVARPKYAMDALDLGRNLAEKGHHARAIKLFDHSLTRPITDYDKKAVQERSSRFFVEGQHEPAIRRRTKAALARSCKAAGELKRAQKLVEELLGPDATLDNLEMIRFAGQVQGASGQRVIEGRIKKVEQEKKDSVRYWLGRASYYVGREENEQAVDAFHSALGLPPDGFRHRAVGQYTNFLLRKREYGRADKLLREELQRVGSNHGSAESLVIWRLAFDAARQFKFASDDPLLWQFLAERKGYGSTDERVLRAFLNKFRAAGNEKAFWDKTLKLAGPGSDPSRRFVVGKLLLQYDDAEQAVPLLEDAFRRWPHPRFQKWIASSLCEAYLKTGEWESAEKVFRSVRSQISVGVQQWLADLAIAAARNGDQDDSLRLWKERANLDMNNLEEISKMTDADAGMREPLRAFYSGLAGHDPDNRAVAAALKALKPQ